MIVGKLHPEKMAAGIRATRAALNLTQEQFGALAGLSRPTIARMEEDPSRTKITTYLKIYPIIERTLSDLIFK